MKSLLAQVPNFLTLGNVFCGCIAIVCISKQELSYAAYFVALAAVFDFFDGFAARLLKVASPLGKQLDSLADAISFGVVPAYMLFTLIDDAMVRNWILRNPGLLDFNRPVNFIPYVAFLLALFAVYRLAKFNIDSRQSNHFVGLPTPANAIFFCSFPLIQAQAAPFYQIIPPANELERSRMVMVENSSLVSRYFAEIINQQVWVLIGLCLLFSYLMIAELPLFSLKFKSLAFKENRIRYLFLLTSLILLLIFHFTALPIIVLLYISMSLLIQTILKHEI